MTVGLFKKYKKRFGHFNNGRVAFFVSQFQKVSFRAKRDPIQSLGFDKVSLNQDFVFGSKKFKMEFDASESFNTDLKDTRIVREDRRYFLIIPQRRPVYVPENQRINAVALDPGVRTFVSFYSDGLHGKVGEGDFKRIYRLCLNLDKLYSKISKAKCEQKRNLRKAAERIRWKIYDLIDDLHKKLQTFCAKPSIKSSFQLLKPLKWLQN